MKTKHAVSAALMLFLLAGSSLTSRAQLLWQVGKDDEGWPQDGQGGGPNTVFVQENGSINDLPGNPNSPAVDQQADNDYYFAGLYNNTIFSVVTNYIDYAPVGEVAANEQAAERAFAGSDNDWRVHFNLPSTLTTNDMVYVTWDPNNLDTSGTDPRYGVEVWFNGVKVQTQIVVRSDGLNTNYVTPQFSLASVNAQVGPGYDNIMSLKGISYSGDGGGSWMGIDYARLDANIVNPTNPPPALPLLWTCGLKDNGWPTGTGGGPNTSFVQENGTMNPLPGSPVSTSTAKGADNDYYFAGSYTTVISSVTNMYGEYTPVGTVAANEEAAERAFAGDDNDLRYHFNLPSSLRPFDLMSVNFSPLSLDDPSDVNGDLRYGVAVYVNGVLVQPEILVRPVDLGKNYLTAQFRLDSVNAQVGPGFDNIVSVKGVNYNSDGGGNWMGIDYVALNAGAISGVADTNPPTVLSVSRYGDTARLKVTFSEKVTSTTANVTTNYVLGSSNVVTLAVLQPDGSNVVLTTAPMTIGTTDALTVTGVKDLAGNPIASTTPVTFTTKYQVLFVTADPGPLTFAGDQAVLAALQARGFNVTLSTGKAVPDDGSTAIGNDLVIVSSSLTSGDVVSANGGAKFMRSPVPVIDWESSLEDDFGFQAANGTTVTNQTQINIVNANSPLAAGFPAGPLTVTTSPQTFSQGTPVGAHIVATSAADPAQAVLYYYEKGERGAPTNIFIMPARRVFFFFQDNTASAANAAGLKLFNAAVDFAMAVQPTGNTNAPTVPMLWTCGIKDNGWPMGTGGGPNASFVQENGSINPLPGSADSTSVAQGADNDYYFAGDYSRTIPSVVAMYGDYTPLGTVAADEEAAERAFAGSDNDLRYHFNLPTSLKPTDVLSVTFAAYNLDDGKPDTRYGVEAFINGVLVQPEIVIRDGQLEVDYTTPQATLASVNAQTGPGADNIVSLKGVNYSSDGGGSWMGFDYVQLNAGTPPPPSVPMVFQSPTISAGKVTLSWTGTGILEWAPAIPGQWTPITPTPTSPYTETIQAGQNRFYRLRGQ